MAGPSKPNLPLGPPPGTHAGDQLRALRYELGNLKSEVFKLREGRLHGLQAFPSVPTGGEWAQGDIVRNSAPSRTISASNTTTFVVWGWQYVDEGLGTLTWTELRFWDDNDTPSQLGNLGWRDNLSSLAAAAQGGGANKPNWGTIRSGLEGWKFSPTAMNELWISFHIDHDYAAGTKLYPHVHVVPLDNIGGVTRWGVEYTFAKGHNQDAFPASSTVYINGTITASSQYRHYIFETPDADAIPGTNIETDGVLLCRIFRDATDPGDTFSTTVAAIYMDLHYQTDHLATLEKAAPFTPLSWGGNIAPGGVAMASITATHTGSGFEPYFGNSGTELVFRRLQEGVGISMTYTAGAIRITNTGGAGGFTAASQTATNIGAGVGVYDNNDGTTLRFRTLVEGTGISITATGSIVRITATAAGGFTHASISATHTGSGEGVYVGNDGTQLIFRKLQEGTGISLTLSAGAIRIASTVTGGGGNSITTTAYASKPSGTVDGTLFMPGDGGPRIERATGTGWAAWGPIYPLANVPSTSWTWLNTTSVTVTHQYGVLHFEGGLAVTAPKFYDRAIAAGSVASFKVTALIAPPVCEDPTVDVGIYASNGAGTAHVFALRYTATNVWDFLTYTVTSITAAAPTFGAAVLNRDALPGSHVWLQMEYTATRFIARASRDGTFWQKLNSTTNTNLIATIVTTGIIFYSNPTSQRPAFQVLSFKEG